MDKASTIINCADAGCGWRCCDFDQGNYIVLLPGEREAAVAAGVSVSHLSTIDGDYHGGERVVCTASNCATCDGGLKPIDCRFYPVYPRVVDGAITLIRGAKCPLSNDDIERHAAAVMAETMEMVADNPHLLRFFAKVEMVGYKPLRPAFPPPFAAGRHNILCPKR